MGLDQITGLDSFFDTYGQDLASQAEEILRPLHVPGTDPIPFNFADKYPKGLFLRQPFEPQAHVIHAGALVLSRQKNVWIIGEMGTGKTLMGMCCVHVHAMRSSATHPNKALVGRTAYRSLVVCPDHLQRKWAREIKETIPKAQVSILRTWQEVLALAPDTVPHCYNQWHEPTGPEYFIIGRDKAKLGCGWKPKLVEVHGKAEKLKTGKVNPDGTDETFLFRPKLLACPRCHAVFCDDKGNPYSWDELPKNKGRLKCKGKVTYLTGDGDGAPKFQERECGEPLYSDTRRPYWRYAPERIIHGKLRGFFDYLVGDEIHEYKSDTSAQAVAISSMAAVAKNVICLTGTLIGGYANHMYPLLFRIAPRSLVEEGFEWGQSLEFSRQYGRVDRIISEKTTHESNKMSRSGDVNTTEREKPAPGIMPPLYGRHVMDKALFLALEQLADNLPKLDEQVIGVDMDDSIVEGYRELQQTLEPAAKELAGRGNLKLCGTCLETMLYYPDHPYGWDMISYEDDGVMVDLVKPKDLDPGVVYAKEQALIDFCLSERRLGNQVWCYVQRTDKRDMLARLSRLLMEHGLEAKVLRSSVKRETREEWIEKQGRGVDVMLSHPQLVETGLDLFSKRRGGHNYSSIIFYQTGYRAFTLRQASRRGWRIGQRKGCKIRYLFYKGTMQDVAMQLMGMKLKAALNLEGKFSEEGLAAMNSDAGDALQMARALANRNRMDAGLIWSKVASFNTGGLEPEPEIPLPLSVAVAEHDEREEFIKRRFLESLSRRPTLSKREGGGSALERLRAMRDRLRPD
jgi:hypothetical protein